MTTAHDAARQYLAAGFQPIPIPHRSKAPTLRDWPNLQTAAEELPRYFNGQPQNIGLLLGEPSGSLVDVDLDHPLAIELADQFLPPTGRVFGRPGKPRSHWLYIVTDAPHRTKRWLAPGNGCVVELRGTGGQTVVPPSTHPSGELIAWSSEGEFTEIGGAELIEALHRLHGEVCRRLGVEPTPLPAGPRDKAPDDSIQGYVAKALGDEVSRIASALEGTRNDALNRAAFSLGQLVGAGLLNRETVESQLAAAAAQAGLPNVEALRTISSGIEAGIAEPRELSRIGLRKGDRAGSRPLSSAPVELADGQVLTLTVRPTAGRVRRAVVATIGSDTHVDKIDVANAGDRNRFWTALADKTGLAADQLQSTGDPQLFALADAADEANEDDAAFEDRESERKTDAERAIDLTLGWELWRTPARDGYATVVIDDHAETWPIKSLQLRRLLGKQFYEAHERPANREGLSAALDLLDAQAQFDGPEYPSFVRVGQLDGKVYIDLCNDRWQVVEISPDGWQVLDRSPVRFRRAKGVLPLPTPQRGGSVDELRPLLNVSDDAWSLVVGWLLGALNPDGPYPLLALSALHGSGKSMTAKTLRALVDPARPALRGPARNEHDLLIAANNAWVPSFDNLSSIPDWMSDAFCRIASGGGFATRELYSNDEEAIFEAMRPIMLTSIEDVATRSDLLDRTVVVSLAPLPDCARQTETDLWQQFEAVRPRILGALYDCVSAALRNLATVKLDRSQRMLDFVRWVAAAEPALGWPAGRFVHAYAANRRDASALAIEASPIGPILVAFLSSQQAGEWSGTANDLLGAFQDMRSALKLDFACENWPNNPRKLAGAIRRLAPNLPAAGWVVSWTRDTTSKRSRLMTFRRSIANDGPDRPDRPSRPPVLPTTDGLDGADDASRA